MTVDARHQGYQDQLSTRALEVANQVSGRVDGAHARIDGLEKLLDVSIKNIDSTLAENRRVRDEQHAQGERRFDRLELAIKSVNKTNYAQLWAVMCGLVLVVGFFVAPFFEHH